MTDPKNSGQVEGVLDGLSFPHVPSVGDIAKAVVDPVVGEIKNNGGDIEKELTKVIKEEIKPLLAPLLPSLNELLDPNELESFVSGISKKISSNTLLKMLSIPEDANFNSLSKQELISLLTSFDRLLDEIDLVIKNLLEGESVPMISVLKNTISSHRGYINVIDDSVWSLIKVPPGLIDIKKVIEITDSSIKSLQDLKEAKINKNIKQSWDVVSLIIRSFLEFLGNLFDLIASIYPLGIIIGADGGVAAGAKIGGQIEFEGFKIGAAVFSTFVFIIKTIGGVLTLVADIEQT